MEGTYMNTGRLIARIAMGDHWAFAYMVIWDS